MKKKFLIISLITIMVMMFSTVFAKTFVDVSKGHWAYEAVSLMEQKGILSGYLDGTFLPDKYITKAEFAKILALSLELTEDDVLSYEEQKEMFEKYGRTYELGDVDQNFWGYEYINLTFNLMPYYKEDGKVFVEPNATINREDVAKAIICALEFDASKCNLDTLKIFSDVGEISESKKPYVAITLEHGIMNGNANGTFNPKGYLTRAEVSKLLYNVYTNFDEIEKAANSFLKAKDMYSKIEISDTREEVIKKLGEPDEINDRYAEVLVWYDYDEELLEVAIDKSSNKVNHKRMGDFSSMEGLDAEKVLDDLETEISKVQTGMNLEEVKAILGDSMFQYEQIGLDRVTYTWVDKRGQHVQIAFSNGLVYYVGLIL